ncbi:hypothetical protein BJ165DRAFT_1408133 [Panaeolus papilionaceus]|nr:hypothetical protein BJ165DRAFT_1408133 [Panaeolus papilionaceus]
MQFSVKLIKFFSLVVVAQLGALTVSGLETPVRREVKIPQKGFKPTCGTRHPSSQERIEIEQQSKALQRQKTSAISANGGIINVNMHIVYTDESDDYRYNGYVPSDWITNQITALNDGFKGTGLSFRLANTTYSMNDVWFNYAYPESDPAIQAMTQLRTGNAGTLNVITAWLPEIDGGQLLGFATFPWWYAGNPSVDGIFIHFHTMPGGAIVDYNQGKTLVHETGHWVGLYHTFQTDDMHAACDPNDPQDLVQDTPLQYMSTDGCPDSRDSCPNAPGLDPIHNYMDYSDHHCQTEFTPDQTSRLHDQMKIYRGVIASN